VEHLASILALPIISASSRRDATLHIKKERQLSGLNFRRQARKKKTIALSTKTAAHNRTQTAISQGSGSHANVHFGSRNTERCVEGLRDLRHRVWGWHEQDHKVCLFHGPLEL